MNINMLNFVRLKAFLTTKMADLGITGECYSQFSVESVCNNDVTNCEKCSEYEMQLKEARDELISIRMINELLQKELFT
jgi:hypothetical protein